MSVNKVILLGNLGDAPKMPSKDICRFSLATNEATRLDENGEKIERTEWHNVVVYGKAAETCAKYLEKGSKVFIDGKLQTRKWEDKEGKTRYSTDIVALRVEFLSKAKQEAQAESTFVKEHIPADMEDYQQPKI
jgi:single-strand DNA-binding protein